MIDSKLTLKTEIIYGKSKITIKEAIDKGVEAFERWKDYNFIKLDPEARNYLIKKRNAALRKPKPRQKPLTIEQILKFTRKVI